MCFHHAGSTPGLAPLPQGTSSSSGVKQEDSGGDPAEIIAQPRQAQLWLGTCSEVQLICIVCL